MDDAGPKRRRHHTRSRAGCLKCKARHVRCDELRPSWYRTSSRTHSTPMNSPKLTDFCRVSTKCRVSNIECAYPAQSLTLEEQRWRHQKTPGMVIWQIKDDKADPFDALPIKMPYRSQELLRYFLDADNLLESTTHEYGSRSPSPSGTRAPFVPKSDKDCIVLAMREPAYFRSTLVLAAVHFSWKVGSLQPFEKPFLFHKQGLIHSVNTWLTQDVQTITTKELKLIAILSISESCVGNYMVAEAHLDGLLTLLEIKGLQPPLEGGNPAVPNYDESLERLLLVAHNFASAVKSRLKSTLAADSDYAMIWQQKFTAIPENLVALRLFPIYFRNDAFFETHPVDSTGISTALRGLNEAVSHRHRTNEAHHVQDSSIANEHTICDDQDPATCIGCKNLSKLLFAFTDSHVNSTRPMDESPSNPALMVSWSALAAASSLYLNTILRLWNAGQPIDRRLFLRLVSNVTRQEASPDMSLAVFWTFFASAYAVMMNIGQSSDSELDVVQRCLVERIRQWSITSGVVDWEKARDILSIVAWPRLDSTPLDGNARHLWYLATSR